MDIHIGKLIKKALIERGIPIRALADSIYKSRPDIYNIFNRKSIDAELIDRISMALNINLFEILARDIDERLGKIAPKELKENHNLLSFINTIPLRQIFVLKLLSVTGAYLTVHLNEMMPKMKDV